MPSDRKCEFKKYHGTYWLEFSDTIDQYYKVTLNMFAGSIYVRTERIDYVDHRTFTQLSYTNLPFDYLLDHGYLREVA